MQQYLVGLARNRSLPRTAVPKEPFEPSLLRRFGWAGFAGGGRLCRRGARSYEGDRAAQMMLTAMTVMAIAPLLGPILGTGKSWRWRVWRAIFWTLLSVGFTTLGVLQTLPTGLQREPLVCALARNGELLRHLRLLGYAGGQNTSNKLLEGLKTDLIDLFYEHSVDANMPIEDVAGAVKDLLQQLRLRRRPRDFIPGISKPGRLAY